LTSLGEGRGRRRNAFSRRTLALGDKKGGICMKCTRCGNCEKCNEDVNMNGYRETAARCWMLAKVASTLGALFDDKGDQWRSSMLEVRG